MVYGGQGDDKLLGGNEWGVDTAMNGYGVALGGRDNIDIAYGQQILVGGDDIAFENSIPVYDSTIGAIDDGDDFLDLGDNNYANFASGNGGNDKIIGGGNFEVRQDLYGGDGDDKIYSINPSQRGTAADTLADGADRSRSVGGNGNDEIHGGDWSETLIGDFNSYGARDPASAANSAFPYGDANLNGGNDVIYGYAGDDVIFGGAGFDFLDGGDDNDTIIGNSGNDKIFGGDGADDLYGDTQDGAYGGSYGNQFGDDIIYGGAGGDDIYGGPGDDILHGDEGDDDIYGGAGEDVLYGGDGDDFLHTGYGWDTVFGGDGCDDIYTYGGGDVVWLGECDGSATQSVSIYGTGDDPENFTVIMDFWLESAKPFNEVCLYRDP